MRMFDRTDPATAAVIETADYTRRTRAGAAGAAAGPVLRPECPGGHLHGVSPVYLVQAADAPGWWYCEGKSLDGLDCTVLRRA